MANYFSNFSYLFLYNNWLAEDRGSCRRYATLFPVHLTDVTGSMLFTHLTGAKAIDYILFPSIFWRPYYSIFTRCQRLSCMIATLYFNMMISAMWFNVKSSNEVEYRLNVGPFSVSYMQLYVGTISLGMTLPLLVFLNMMFRYRKTKAKTVRFVNVRSNSCLPHWIQYVGHVVCLITIVCGFLVTFLYSLQWGGEISNNWLMSVFFGLLVDVTLGPIQVRI